jgi:DNA-binding transcriptional LysR family regulator
VLTDHLLDVVEEDFDLAVRVSGPPSDKFTIWRKICVVRRILVTAPGTPWASATHPSELSADACLGFAGDSRREQWLLNDGKSRFAIDAGESISANNGEVLARLAADGSGVTLLPTFIVAELMREGRLVQILPQWQPPELWLTLFYPPYHALPPRIATFSSFFETNIAPLVTAME